jgi:hypothetical protein
VNALAVRRDTQRRRRAADDGAVSALTSRAAALNGGDGLVRFQRCESAPIASSQGPDALSESAESARRFHASLTSFAAKSTPRRSRGSAPDDAPDDAPEDATPLVPVSPGMSVLSDEGLPAFEPHAEYATSPVASDAAEEEQPRATRLMACPSFGCPVM